MGKILFWFLVILAALLVARLVASHKARQRNDDAQAPQAPPRPAGSGQPSLPMVRCAHCGIHLPRNEALLLGGETWCSQEHARQGRRP